MPTLENNLKTHDGEDGWLCTFYNHDEKGEPTREVANVVLNDTRVRLNDFMPEGLEENWSIKLTGILTVDKTMPFELGLAVAGQ